MTAKVPYHNMPRAASKGPSDISSTRIGQSIIKAKWQVFYFTIVASLSEIANGYDIGAFSIAIPLLQSDNGLGLSAIQLSIIVGMFNLVSALGCLFAGPLNDTFGRKVTLIGGNIVNVIGTLVVTFAKSFEIMFIGRFVMGLGAGISFMGPEVYGAEITPPQHRGLVATFGELFINFGILFGYFSGWLATPSWRLMIGIGTILPVIALVLQIFIPESPRWLVEQGREEEAKRSLVAGAHYSDDDAVQEQIDEIKSAIDEEHNAAFDTSSKTGKSFSRWRELLHASKGLRRAMMVGWGVAIMQQITASEGVVYFAPTILESIGFEGTNQILGWTVAIGAFKAFFIVPPLFLMDRFGRRPFLLISTFGITLALLMLGCFSLVEPPLSIGLLLALFLFMASFSMGFGPLTGVYLAEAFPLHIRGTAVGVGWALNRVVSGSIALVFLPLSGALGEGQTGIGLTFCIFGGVSVLVTAYVIFLVPETKGLSLEEIQHLFMGPKSDLKSASLGESSSKSTRSIVMRV